MRSFKNVATLIRTRRTEHPKQYSQADLSDQLGYKNGQLVSNIERGLCSLPLKMMKKASEILSINPDELKAAILKDYEETLTKYFNK